MEHQLHTNEMRGRPRKECRYMPVDFILNDRLQNGLIMDLSETGAKIESYHPLLAGESTTMTFMEHYTMGPVKTKCHVVRSFGGGFAVEFDNLLFEYEMAIGKFVGHA